MTPRKGPRRSRRPAPPPALTASALLVLAVTGGVTLLLRYPREACAVGRVLCREELQPLSAVPSGPPPPPPPAPTPVRNVPEEPLSGQARPRDGRCPAGYEVINGGCWLRAQKKPPCPVRTYRHLDGCFTPLELDGEPFRNTQQPWR